MRPIHALALSLLLAAPALAGVDAHTFYLHDYFFSTINDPEHPGPTTLTINPGDPVRWIWVANYHSVLQVSGPGVGTPFHSAFSSTQGFTFEHTFTESGDYDFICEIHGGLMMPGMPAGMWGTVTVAASTACGPADVGVQGGQPGNDGRLDNNDFIAFINLFFDSNSAADQGTQGGLPGSDNAWDNNDFIAFINHFFNPPAGC